MNGLIARKICHVVAPLCFVWAKRLLTVALSGTVFLCANAIADDFSKTPNTLSNSDATKPQADLQKAAQPEASPLVGDGTLPLDSIRLKISFDKQLFDAPSEKQKLEQLATFCKVWQEAFMKDKGPWGFGIASDVVCSIAGNQNTDRKKAAENFDTWLLAVEKTELNERAVIQASLCRFKEVRQKTDNNSETVIEEKCEARKAFPWSNFRLRFVRHRAFVRLLAASLLDQLPFVSLVTKGLVRFDKLRISGFPEPNTVEVNFPPPPEELIFADVRFDPYASRFRLKELAMKDAVYRAMTQTGTSWIVSREGRGGRLELFNKNIESAFSSLSTNFELDQLKYEKDKAKFIAASLKKRPYMDLIFRGDLTAGMPLLSMRNYFGGSAHVGLRINSKFGGGLSLAYGKSKYELGTQVEEKDSAVGIQSSTLVNLSEVDVWFEPRFYRSFNWSGIPQIQIAAGPRVGYVASQGDLKTNGSLPQDNLSIQSRELGLGLSFGACLEVSPIFEVTASTLFNLGVNAKSTALRAGTEAAWILARLSTPGRSERPPALRIGASASFSSLSRRFVNSDAARTFETLATLNGLQTAFFVEKAF